MYRADKEKRMGNDDMVTSFNDGREAGTETQRVHLSRAVITESVRRDKERKPFRQSIQRKITGTVSQCCRFQTFLSMFPVLTWIREYHWRTDLLADFLAGLTVGIMSIPQGMAYARLAGMPPVYGLYSNIIPTFVYFFLGTAKLAAIGPATVLSLITASIRYKHIPCEDCWLHHASNASNASMGDMGDHVTPINIGSALAFLIGVYMIIMGLFRLSFLSNYLPDQLVGGFTMAAAVQVMAGQLSSTFGIKLPERIGVGKVIMNFIDLFSMIGHTNVATLLIFIVCFLFLIFCKHVITPPFQRKLRVPFPGEFIVMVGATIASHFGHFRETYQVSTVRYIAAGFPAPQLPTFSIMSSLAGDAAVLAIITYSYAISLAKLYGKRNGYKIDSGQEFYAYGLMNLAGSFFQCFNSGLTVARCMVYEMAGAKSQLCGMFGTAVVIVAVVFLAQFLASLPNASLAAIIIAACVEMFRNLRDLPNLYRKSKYDFSIYMITFASVVLLDVTTGLAVSVSYALITVVIRSQRAKLEPVETEARVLYTSDKVNNEKLTRDENGLWERIKVLRLTTPLFYANADRVVTALSDKGALTVDSAHSDKLTMMEGDEPENHVKSSIGQPVAVILDMTAVAFTDLMGINALKEISKRMKDQGITFCLCGCTETVESLMKSSGFMDTDVMLFPTVLDALSYARGHF